MPLPKSAPIAARATEVYCEVWSVILQRTCKMPPTRTSDLNDLSELLPYLRQLLTCCACAGLLDNAMISLACGHCYCYECQYREPLLKIQCRQCRERTGLVMESQLQLLVKCYKQMCYVLGEELRRDPLVLGRGVKSEPEAAVVPKGGPPNDGIDKSLDKRDDDKEVTVPSPKDPPKAIPPTKKTPSNPDFDPIAEIVREVEEGLKVSRDTLFVKPPSKYRNIKAAITPRKELTVSAPPTTDPSPTQAEPGEGVGRRRGAGLGGGKVRKTVKREKKLLGKKTLKQTRVANLKLHHRKRMAMQQQREVKVKEEGKEEEEGKGEKKEEGKEEEEEQGEGDKASQQQAQAKQRKKRKLRKTFSSPTRRGVDHAGQPPRPKKRKKTAGKRPQTLTKTPTTSTEEDIIDVGGETLPPDTKPPLGLSVTAAISFDCYEVKVESLPVSVECLDSNCLKVSQSSVTLLPEERHVNVLAEALERISSPSWRGAAAKKAEEAWGEGVRTRKWDPLCPSVSVRRARDDIVKMVMMQCKAARSRRKTRHRTHHSVAAAASSLSKHSAQLPPRPCPPPLPSHPPHPLPPSHQHHHHQHHLPPPPHRKALPSRPPAPPSLPPHASLSPSSSSPSSHPYPAPGDIPLPDDISFCGNSDLMEPDMDWQELSDYLESNDEDSSAPVPPPQPLGRYGLPPHPPPPPPPPPHSHLPPHQHPAAGPPPHHPRLNPVHFKNYSRQGHLIHPPYLHPPPPSHHPPHPHTPPGHHRMPHTPHRLPHPPPPPPPPGPHTPMMPPFGPSLRPDMRPDMPPHGTPHEGYFHHHPPHPMVGGPGPEDFLPPGSGNGGGPPMRPDTPGAAMGGFSGPMTPGSAGGPSYSPGGNGGGSSGMCPEGTFQHSPGPHTPRGHHPQTPHTPHPPPHHLPMRGHFPPPMHSPRMGFPPPPPHHHPPNRFFPEPPLIMPKPKQQPKKTSMNAMVRKMKIKTPSGRDKERKAVIITPTSPAEGSGSGGSQGAGQVPGKKRRSPGYSEVGWRCRCGTNNVMFPDKVCAKGKCPCYTKGVACKNCLCRHCHNPFGVRELGTSPPGAAAGAAGASVRVSSSGTAIDSGGTAMDSSGTAMDSSGTSMDGGSSGNTDGGGTTDTDGTTVDGGGNGGSAVDGGTAIDSDGTAIDSDAIGGDVGASSALRVSE